MMKFPRESNNFFKKSVGILLVIYAAIVNADPNCTNLGRLYYLGTDGMDTFWLSISNARIQDAQLQGPAAQVVDNFSMFPNELHLSASPYSGQHTLYNIKNSGPCFIDSAQQTPRPPEFPEFPGGGGPGDGGSGGSGGGDGSDGGNGGGSGSGNSSGGFDSASGGNSGGSNVLSQIVKNVNKNFLATYLLRTYSVSDRVDNAFLRSEQEICEQRWQIWIEPKYAGLHSRVATGKPNINSRNVQAGISYNLNKMMVLGLSAVGNNSDVNAFSGGLVNKNQNIIVGPYVGVKVNNVVLDAWLIYGHNDINSNLLGLRSNNFVMNSLMASGDASVLFNIYDFVLQPKLSVFYSHNKTSKFNYTGVIPNRNVSVTLRMSEDKFNYSHAALTAKLLREIPLNKVILIPSLTAGINDNFKLPDHGRYLNQNQHVASVSPRSGIVKAGLGAKLLESLRLDLLAGYYSIGVKEDLWDVGLTLTLGI